MIRYIEVPDFHADPAWIQHSADVGKRIEDAAAENKVDFIALAGDFFNRPLFASDRSHYNEILNIVRLWLTVCPVIAIEGTPSHDGPGAYGPLEELGVTLLRPGMAYLGKRMTDQRLAFSPAVTAQDMKSPADVLAFGIPELNKSNATSLSADDRAGDTLTALSRYIDEFIAPRRAMRQDLPAVGLLHGDVSDARREHETDVILRQSSLLIHTEDLARAGLDRWSLGHIHTPWESMRICAGYGGFTGVDGNPWGKTGFTPAMNLVTLAPEGQMSLDGSFSVDIDCIPYGTPERVKITEPLASYDPDIAYWLASPVDDPALNPALNGGHPWSRITFETEKTATRRVTREQNEKAAGLADLMALMSPDDVTPSIREKLDSIDTERDAEHKASSADLQRLRVKGCTFFHGKEACFDARDLPRELIELHGEDNGSGKSSILCFATPYPVTVGRPTESGRPSAIHEFFGDKDSWIEKVFMVDGQQHRHVITIKGAHTQNPSLECFLEVSGQNVMIGKGFDEMMTVCERLYGPLDDHLLTAFNVQPGEARAAKSIAASTPTELRERVLRISDIDRSREAAAANTKVTDLSSETDKLNAKISARQDDVDDIPTLKAELESASNEEVSAAAKASRIESEIESLMSRVNSAAVAAQKSKAEASRKADDTATVSRLHAANGDDLARIDSKRELIKDRLGLEETLEKSKAGAERIKELSAQKVEVDAKNAQIKSEYDAQVVAYNESVRALQKMHDDRDAALALRDKNLTMAASIEQPCEACGHIADSQATQARRWRDEADTAHMQAQLLDHKIGRTTPPVKPAPPEYEVFDGNAEMMSIETLTAAEVSNITARITEADRAEASIEEITRQIVERRSRMKELSAAVYEIDPEAEDVHEKLKAEHRIAQDTFSSINNRLKGIQYNKAKIEGRLEISQRAAEASERDSETLNALAKDLADWKWIALNLRPNKLPAFELDMMLDEVDERSTRYVYPFREGRYRIRTETQGVGKTGVVDRFRVMVLDTDTGEEKSLLKHSGGEKVFLADAYQKALLDLRKERRGVMHEPVVFDETDGAIRPERIAEYYQMQTDYFQGVRCLVVSHAPDAQNYIQNRVSMGDVLGEPSAVGRD